MAEEYIYERERDFLDYIRNNTTDPSNRGTDIVDESFTATASQTVFTLANTLVKNVAENITVDGVNKRKGYDFSVQYGKGTAVTTVTLKVGATEDDTVLISYHYGASMIEREFSRTDVTLPRIVIMFVYGDEEFAALGDAMEGGKGSYFNVSFRLEIRDRYADRAREVTSKLYNLIRKLRQQSLFRTNISSAGDMQNFDYVPEKEAYVWQLSADIQWEILYE